MDDKTHFNWVIMGRPRTAGDGMESALDTGESSKGTNDKSFDRTVMEQLANHKLVQIFPTKLVRSDKKSSNVYAKNPKFVPYEPYVAAVKPIVPQTFLKGHKKSASKNNMDINQLITQMSQMDTKQTEYKPRAKLTSVGSKSLVTTAKNIKPVEENDKLQKIIEELKNENTKLKEQLSQQAQVNKELKTMLVASMGEDLETQVQSLNEDKKHLADALVNSAQHLSTHQDQTEWLAGQCEVWRSKFLASSLMVEELAHWKNLLNERTENLQYAIAQLLDERSRGRDLMIHTYKNLYTLHEKWLENVAISEYKDDMSMYSRNIGNVNMTTTMPQSSNILDLASVNLKLSENLSSSFTKQDVSKIHTLPSETEAEKLAEKIIAMPLDIKRVNEAPVNALVHHAYSNSGATPKPIASCLHCNGRVQLL